MKLNKVRRSSNLTQLDDELHKSISYYSASSFQNNSTGRWGAKAKPLSTQGVNEEEVALIHELEQVSAELDSQLAKFAALELQEESEDKEFRENPLLIREIKSEINLRNDEEASDKGVKSPKEKQTSASATGPVPNPGSHNSGSDLSQGHVRLASRTTTLPAGDDHFLVQAPQDS